MNMLTEFIFEKFEDAMDVHTKLFRIGFQNGYVTYNDLYSMIHEKFGKEFESELKDLEIYNKHGWTRLIETKLEQVGDGWMLILPPIENLENLIKYKKEDND